MRMKKQHRKMSSSSIMHHPQSLTAATTTTSGVEATVRERRTSSNSDSSVEPMEISHHTATSASDANNSSLQVTKSHHSSEEEDDQNNNHSNNPLKKLYIKTRRGLVNGNSGRRSDEDADAEEDEKEQQQYTASWRRNSDKEQQGNYLTILRKKGRYSSSRGGPAAAEEKWNGKDEFEAAIQSQNSVSAADVTCRICSKVFPSAPLLMAHIVMVHHNTNHNNNSLQSTPLSCHICQMPFTNGANLQKHWRKVHNLKFEHGNQSEDEGAVSTDSSASSHNNNNNNTSNGHKRKSMDDLNEEDEEEAIVGSDGRIVVRKRKMRTINNNNNILANNNNLSATTTSTTQQKYCCPACDRNDFPTMASVEFHLDEDHPNIVPKCRHCASIFKSHKQLNGHRCTQAMGNHRALGRNQQITQGFKDLTFMDFSSNKFPYIAKSICEQSIRTPIAEQKFECTRCYRAFPCEAALSIHHNDCAGNASAMNMSLQSDGSHESQKRRLSHDGSEGDLKRDDFFANLDLQNKSIASSNNQLNSSSGQFSPHSGSSNSSTHTSPLMMNGVGSAAAMAANAKHFHSKFQQGMDFGRLPFDMRNGKDLADIESIINVTSGGRFFKHLDHSANTTGSSSCKSVDLNSSMNSGRDDLGQEEEAQDMFTCEFRRMKLRGEFPCKLCTAVYPNLRALKGHNRVHLSAAGAGPYRCNMCPYSIHDKAALIRHMRTHNGDRPYECALCNYAFTTKANCERHLRNRHAKATRDEIKRAIIYHPSEDSSCDDPHKKMAMFAATDFGAAPLPDPDVLHARDHSRESKENRTSTPVSHLKEMLMPNVLSSPTMVPMLPKHSSSPLSLSQQQQLHKIQVKSLEKLTQNDEEEVRPHRGEMHQKVVMSDALDLSKKVEEERVQEQRQSRPTSPIPNQMAAAAAAMAAAAGMPFMDMALLKKQEELLLAQQKLFKDAMPQLGPAQYFQELYRNFLFPGAFPFLPFFGAPNGGAPAADESTPMLPNPMLDIKNFMQQAKDISPAAAVNPLMSGGSALLNPAAFFSPNAMLPNQMAQTPTQQPLKPQIKSPEIPNDLMKSLNIPGTPTGASQGSVKMVIKNGVLMPKQKQRRYRTERPFACEHCSARFTLRSNMERHIKQQHPQYWAQRQRSGHQLLRRSHGGSSLSPSSGGLPTMISPGSTANPFTNLSEEMKFLLQLNRDQKMPFPFDAAKFTEELERRRDEHAAAIKDEMDDEPEEDMMDEEEEEEEEDDTQLVIDEDSEHETEAPATAEVKVEGISAAKKVAESILEQAMKKNLSEPNNNNEKEEDLASITKLVDNARAGSMSFNNFFRSDRAASTEQSDEEGLVASGSASEENQSGAEDQTGSSDHNSKKKSAYSMAPNRVACPYCQRMFPWTSSLRRHILTHTGQKPFKCSHCPLLFTTKSNCDRHLLRKHGNVESAQSLYMPIEENGDIPEPTPLKETVPPNMPALIPVSQLRSSKVEAEDEPEDDEDVEEEDEDEEEEGEEENAPPKTSSVDPAIPSINVNQLKSVEGGNFISSDMPFKCHLCDASFPERLNCLEHIKVHHNPEYERLVANGSIEMDANAIFSESAEDEKKSDGKGKYPDYANRKVICAFCVRRFWSAEDLRRHMRTHSGERPFQCDVCSRKFTLKHSMLRHQKKHQRRAGLSTQSCSDMSDEEVNTNQNSSRKTTPNQVVNGGEEKVATPANSSAFLAELMKRSPANSSILGMLMSRGRGEQGADGGSEVACDFLANMLGIGDQGLLAKAFQSPEEAAKLLGVDK